MERDKLQKSFERLGIQPRDYGVLVLLPLVYVAWADGKMALVQKDRIESHAARAYDLSAGAMAVLRGWLSERPSHDYIVGALHDIYLLAQANDDGEIDLSELPSLLAYAEGIARSTAQALDQPNAVTASEDRALEEIARELHVDHGESWAKLLNELR